MSGEMHTISMQPLDPVMTPVETPRHEGNSRK